MEIGEYIAYLENMTPDELKQYLYKLELKDLTPEQRAELERYLAKLKREKALVYIAIFGFLQVVGSKLLKPLKISRPEMPADPKGEYDFVWVNGTDPCPECQALAGKRWDKDTDLAPPLHPHCKCKYVKKYRTPKQEMKAMTTPMRLADAGDVRAVLDGGKRILEVLAAPYGGPDNRDRLNQYFTPRTDFMIDVGDRRPALYFHGFSPRARAMDKPVKIGIAEATRIDGQGVWMQTELDDSPLSTRTWEAALKGNARASTGSINYLARNDKVSGEVITWPIAELSVFDAGDKRIPVSDDAVVLPLRAIYDECKIHLPKRFEVGETMNKGESESHHADQKRGVDMDEIQKAVQEALAAQKKAEVEAAAAEEAMRAEIRKEMEAEKEPNYRGIFNINKINGKAKPITDEDAKRGVTKESREEKDAFVWALMNPTQAPAAMRVLEESEALEGGPMVPSDMLNEIVEIKGAQSIIDKIGLHRYQTDKLIFNFPTETAAMGALAAIAEEGAYVANEPAFATVAATVVKYGSMVSVTEEMLEDQNLFEPYFVKAVGKAWALAENLELFTKVTVTASQTQGVHSATFTAAEILTWFFSVTDPWADGGSIVMNRATMGTMRGLLIATPRAFGAFPDFGGGDYPTFMGVPAFTNGNWELAGAGDEDLVLSYLHPDAIGWVENGALSIKVDPYGDSLNGRVRYFPRTRFDCEVLQVLGNVTYTDHA